MAGRLRRCAVCRSWDVGDGGHDAHGQFVQLSATVSVRRTPRLADRHVALMPPGSDSLAAHAAYGSRSVVRAVTATDLVATPAGWRWFARCSRVSPGSASVSVASLRRKRRRWRCWVSWRRRRPSMRNSGIANNISDTADRTTV